MDEKIEANVPLEPLGIANGVKNFGGLLDQNIRSLTVECFPKDLRNKIRVEVSPLNIGVPIKVRALSLPNGVVAKVKADLTAFSVAAPTAEEEPVTPEAEAAAAVGPEVITAKKEEGEEAPAAGAKGAPTGGKGAAAPAKGAPAAAPKEKETKK